jgi:hypothetical protein
MLAFAKKELGEDLCSQYFASKEANFGMKKFNITADN